MHLVYACWNIPWCTSTTRHLVWFHVSGSFQHVSCRTKTILANHGSASLAHANYLLVFMRLWSPSPLIGCMKLNLEKKKSHF